MADCIFTTNDCGKTSGTATSPGCPPGNDVEINGSTDLSTCIIGNSGATVYGIRIEPNAGIYDYTIQVDAKGPEGFGSGWLNLKFTDETNDTYSLGIYSSRRQQHTVSYNSQQPAITKIEWGS